MMHVGRIRNTGRKCLVVFREIYDEEGHVIDPDSCLIVETESLPDAEHQDIMRIVENDIAQTTPELYNVFARERLGNGDIALQWMHSSGRLRKYPTDNVDLIPDSRNIVRLDILNRIVKLQNEGRSEEEINSMVAKQMKEEASPHDINVTAQDIVENVSRNAQNENQEEQRSNPVLDHVNDSVVEDAVVTGEQALDDKALANQFLSQAAMFEEQARDLRDRASQLTGEPLTQQTKRRRGRPNKNPVENPAADTPKTT